MTTKDTLALALEALEAAHNSMRQVVHFRETGQGRPPEQTCLAEIELTSAAITAIKQAQTSECSKVTSEYSEQALTDLLEDVEKEIALKAAELGIFNHHATKQFIQVVRSMKEAL